MQDTIREWFPQSPGGPTMQFGPKVRELRQAKGFTQRELAGRLGVSFTYVSKVENEKLHFGDYPSEKFIHKLAEVLDSDEDDLLLLAQKIPLSIRRRVLQRPDAFSKLAGLDDKSLDRLIATINT